MPLIQPGQEAHPDFSTHLNNQHIFRNMTDLGQDRDLTTTLLLELWRTRAGQEVPQAEPQPQLPQQPQHSHRNYRQAAMRHNMGRPTRTSTYSRSTATQAAVRRPGRTSGSTLTTPPGSRAAYPSTRSASAPTYPSRRPACSR